MKVLFEVPLQTKDHKKSHFCWLNNENNWLFIIEDGKKMKTLSVKQNPGREVQTGTLTESRICTSLSWNKDGSVLAIVVDKRQIYLWEMKNNNFTHIKPLNKATGNSNSSNKRTRSKDIELVEWSKLSNKLVICYSTGQLLLCNCDSKLTERQIDSSEGVLREVAFIESSSQIDLFVCITVISEVLVMTYDGDIKFYIQSEDLGIIRAKFSFPSKDFQNTEQTSSIHDHQSDLGIWLAYSSKDNRIFFKKISSNVNFFKETSSKEDIVFVNESINAHLVDYHWLSTDHLIACFSSGIIILLQLKLSTNNKKLTGMILGDEILHLGQELATSGDEESSLESFKSFKVMNRNKGDEDIGQQQDEFPLFSLAAITEHRMFYYELFEMYHKQAGYVFEKVDDLDLSSSLKKLKLQLERVEWSYDGSMVAVQLTNGHILVYCTRLTDYMVTSYGPKTAYLSGMNEITVLDYGTDLSKIDRSSVDDANYSGSEGSNNDNALVINVAIKPSVIAISPSILAIALNNRVRFYLLNKSSEQLFDEQEYVSIVVALKLNSKFVAVHLNDGRIKLHAIQSKLFDNKYPERAGKNSVGYIKSSELECESDERFFPDPAEPERICSFTLTEDLFIYSSEDFRINIFSLKRWTTSQVCDHSKVFGLPIVKIQPNDQGNKFVCLTQKPPTNQNNHVYLYDLYSNKLFALFEDDLYAKIFESQLDTSLLDCNKIVLPQTVTRPKMGPIKDAIWDTDGRTMLLIARDCIHITVVMDQMIGKEGTIVEYLTKEDKPLGYTTLYASQGIVSFQTKLGRIINSILSSHDDELKLAELEQAISRVKQKKYGIESQAEVMRLKLIYVREILPIYSLSKSKEICEHLMSDEQFNFEPEQRNPDIDSLIWKQLAARALFTQNLNFALLVYRKHSLPVHARALSEIIRDAHKRGLDRKYLVRPRILKLLGINLDHL